MSRGQDGAHPSLALPLNTPAMPFIHSVGAQSIWPLHCVPAECGLPDPHGPTYHVALFITPSF